MKLHMLKTVNGSSDGIHVSLYKEGEEYDISPSLAKTFLKHNFAVEVPAQAEPKTVIEEVIKEPKEEKEEKSSKKNVKSFRSAPENKEMKEDEEPSEDEEE